MGCGAAEARLSTCGPHLAPASLAISVNLISSPCFARYSDLISSRFFCIKYMYAERALFGSFLSFFFFFFLPSSFLPAFSFLPFFFGDLSGASSSLSTRQTFQTVSQYKHLTCIWRHALHC